MNPSVIAQNKKRKPMWAWAWFAYTGFLFIQPVMEPSLRAWTIALVSVAIFAVIFVVYERISDCEHPLRFWLIGSTFLLGLAVFPSNPGGTTFFIYTAGFLPFNIRSTARVLALFALESLIVIAEARLFHLGWANALFTIFMLVIIGGSNIFFAQQKRSDFKLRLANEEIEALAAVAERERIARDLHDVLGHTLSLIVLKAELAGRLLDGETLEARDRARAELADVERTARTALAEVREAIGGYRSKGLAAEIDAARRTLEAAGVTLKTDAANANLTGLNAQEETVLALAMREAVTNIVRHARATTCRLRFASENGRRRLIVEDDGQNTTAQEGNGLRGMRERVEALGGNMDLDRSHGTRLSIELPLAPTGVAS